MKHPWQLTNAGHATRDERRTRYTSYLDEALQLARKFEKQGSSTPHQLEGTLGELQFFSLPECCLNAEAENKHKGLMDKIKAVFRN